MKSEYETKAFEKFKSNEIDRFHPNRPGSVGSSHARIFGSEVPDVGVKQVNRPKFVPEFEAAAPVRRKFEELHSEVLKGSANLSEPHKAAIFEHRERLSPRKKLGSEMKGQNIISADSKWNTKEYSSNLPLPVSDPKQRKLFELNTSPVLELQYKNTFIHPQDLMKSKPTDPKNWMDLAKEYDIPSPNSGVSGYSSRKNSVKLSSSGIHSLSQNKNRGFIDSTNEYSIPTSARRRENETFELKVVDMPSLDRKEMSKIVRDKDLNIVISTKDDLILKEHKTIKVRQDKEDLESVKIMFKEHGIKVEDAIPYRACLKKNEIGTKLPSFTSRPVESRNGFVRKILQSSKAKKENEIKY